VFCLVRRNAPGTARCAAEITHLVQATWGTLNLQDIPGFQGFWGLASRDDGERVASASFYSDKRAASAASDAIDAWVRTHARQLLPHPPEVFLGECFVHEAPEPPRDASVYCSIRSIRAWRAGGDGPTAERVRRSLAGMVGEDGFRGASAFLDEASGDVVAVTLADTRDRARHGHGLPGGAPWTTSGRVAVAARTWGELCKGGGRRGRVVGAGVRGRGRPLAPVGVRPGRPSARPASRPRPPRRPCRAGSA
jgi:hypothetical protein